MLLTVFLVFFGYGAGSVSTAILVCKLWGLPDPRSVGSQNPGATNVLRLGGKKPAAVTLIGDFLKGLLPVLLASLLVDSVGTALVGLAAFLGHLYPVFFGFKGGKGVATAAGVLFGFAPLVGLAALCVWLVVAYGLRISSVAALLASLLTPLFLWLSGQQPAYTLTGSFMVVLLLWRHRQNIQRLLKGTESTVRGSSH